MHIIHLDPKKREQLIKNIQEFVLNESNMECRKVQASKLLDSILDKVSSDIYDQIVFEINCDLQQKTEEMLGIERKNLN